MFSYTCSIDICSLFSQLVVECYLLFNSFIYAMSLVQNIYGLVEQRSKIWCSVSHLFSCPVVQFHVGQMAFEESVFCSIVLFNSCCSTAFFQATWLACRDDAVEIEILKDVKSKRCQDPLRIEGFERDVTTDSRYKMTFHNHCDGCDGSLNGRVSSVYMSFQNRWWDF